MKINMDGLHHNSKEWQRHDEFLPERFNPESYLFLTPDGKKRNPYSWLPFNGGQRICFGKSFAEFNLSMFDRFLKPIDNTLIVVLSKSPPAYQPNTRNL